VSKRNEEYEGERGKHSMEEDNTSDVGMGRRNHVRSKPRTKNQSKNWNEKGIEIERGNQNVQISND